MSLVRWGGVLAVIGLGCGDNVRGQEPEPELGTTIELPLLQDGRGHNHSCEVSVAAHDGRVVVAAIHLHLKSSDSFEPDERIPRRVAVHVSHDHGETFEPPFDPVPDDPIDDISADPVVRAARDGSFVLGLLRPAGGTLLRTVDGRTWNLLVEEQFGDKEWLAIDDESQEIYVGATDGYLRYAIDGALVSRHPAIPMPGIGQGAQMADAYVDSTGAHFAANGGDGPNEAYRVVRWDGVGDPVEEPPLDPGADAQMFTMVSWSIGALPTGRWSVRARREAGLGAIVVRTEMDGVAHERELTLANSNAFLPAAVMDGTGMLHAVWYDSAGPDRGVLRYTRSRSRAPFVDGFLDPIEIDNDAIPVGFYPGGDTPSGSRRLREYIGIAVDEGIVHIAWTHAPTAPSRVRVISFPVPGD